MARKIVYADEDRQYYGRSWWQVSLGRIGCIIAVIVIVCIVVPIVYAKYFKPTLAVKKLNNKDTPKNEKLIALRVIRKAKFKRGFGAAELRVTDEQEDLEVRGEAVKTVAALGGRAQKVLREVFVSAAPARLRMEILNHLDEEARQLVEECAASPDDEEFLEACREWLAR
ncbi:MAG: hypothetical protein E3J72_09035 [Planctomycetota bacterium]|nr:MAG: hypothetical protein E3J72_09035 [Planctomycetota bacterium]